MEWNKNMQCWKYNNSGPGKDLLCPAAEQNEGRSCWLVAKTLCGGKVHGKHIERTFCWILNPIEFLGKTAEIVDRLLVSP